MTYLDPGPVPAVVEPETTGVVTTILVSPRRTLVVTADYRGTGLTGLTVMDGHGDAVTTALPAPSVDALLDALAAASYPRDAPELPEVRVLTPEAGR